MSREWCPFFGLQDNVTQLPTWAMPLFVCHCLWKNDTSIAYYEKSTWHVYKKHVVLVVLRWQLYCFMAYIHIYSGNDKQRIIGRYLHLRPIFPTTYPEQVWGQRQRVKIRANAAMALYHFSATKPVVNYHSMWVSWFSSLWCSTLVRQTKKTTHKYNPYGGYDHILATHINSKKRRCPEIGLPRIIQVIY